MSLLLSGARFTAPVGGREPQAYNRPALPLGQSLNDTRKAGTALVGFTGDRKFNIWKPLLRPEAHTASSTQETP